jgi:NAD-dependent dihydropyrimidine dehydrogenase PreA subunit
MGCVFWDDGANKPMICIHCGLCTGYCPHKVLKLEKEEA